MTPAAAEVGERIARRRVLQRFGKRMRVYDCEFCHGWHLTGRLTEREGND